MILSALCFLCLVLGLMAGYELRGLRTRKQDAPLPDFDPTNPINAQHEPVEICGRTFYRMN